MDESEKLLSVTRHAHCSDLTILTQADRASPRHGVDASLVESVILLSARPTLVLPAAGGMDHLPENILVAWNDTREAARALGDALPLLRESILGHAHRSQADLVVMGACGHSRWTELVMGTATRGSLLSSTVALLKSH